MSTVPNSIVDSNSYRSSGLPDELSPAGRALFEQGLNEWEAERAERECTAAQANADVDEYEYWHARAQAEQAAFHRELSAHIAAMRQINSNMSEITRAIA